MTIHAKHFHKHTSLQRIVKTAITQAFSLGDDAKVTPKFKFSVVGHNRYSIKKEK